MRVNIKEPHDEETYYYTVDDKQRADHVALPNEGEKELSLWVTGTTTGTYLSDARRLFHCKIHVVNKRQ